METIEEVQIFWEGPFKTDDIINGNIDKQGHDVKAKDKGLYQIYGSHPLYGDNVLVYIGRTKNKSGFKTRLKDRWVTQFGSDSNNVQIYLGTIFSDSKGLNNQEIDIMIDKAEILLINALKPAYNSSNIQSVKNDLLKQRFIIHNEGNYKKLHPILDSKYFWHTYSNFAIVNTISKLLSIPIDNENDYYGFYLNKHFDISEEKYMIWIGVDYEIWNKLKIPLTFQVYSKDEKIIQKIKKLRDFKPYKFEDEDKSDTYYMSLDSNLNLNEQLLKEMVSKIQTELK